MDTDWYRNRYGATTGVFHDRNDLFYILNERKYLWKDRILRRVNISVFLLAVTLTADLFVLWGVWLQQPHPTDAWITLYKVCYARADCHAMNSELVPAWLRYTRVAQISPVMFDFAMLVSILFVYGIGKYEGRCLWMPGLSATVFGSVSFILKLSAVVVFGIFYPLYQFDGSSGKLGSGYWVSVASVVLSFLLVLQTGWLHRCIFKNIIEMPTSSRPSTIVEDSDPSSDFDSNGSLPEYPAHTYAYV